MFFVYFMKLMFFIQIIAWLRPAVARRGVLANLVTAAMAWCDGYDKPLLVPLNGW